MPESENICNNMHMIRKYIPDLLPVLLLICLCQFIACEHPVRRLVFQPHEIRAVPTAPEKTAGFQRFWLKTTQGNVEWWLFPGDGIGASQQGPAVLMAHGNRELIDFYVDRAQAYQKLGFTVLLGEYRGYGRSDGRPSREDTASDFRRFFDRLALLPTVDAGRIVFHGRSLGG